jgi:Family of unknown function (DUF5683)
MRNRFRTFLFLGLILMSLLPARSRAQLQRADTTVVPLAAGKEKKQASKPSPSDTAHKKPRSEPAKAATRSAILPGLGQAYNKKYWKIPIVYIALAIPTYTFVDNLNWYKKTRDAYKIRYYNDTSTVSDLPTDSIDPRLKPLSTSSLKLYRNEFRKNMDFSVLAFLLLWGLQVVDATVDAHLRSFNVTDDLSLKVRPYYTPVGNSTGVSVVLGFGKNSPTKTIVTR